MTMPVSLYNAFYDRQGQTTHYLSCSVEWAPWDVGIGTLVMAETHRLVPLLRSVRDAPVLVRVDTPSGVRWTGRVVKVTYTRPGKAGTGIYTASLVHDWIWLRYLLASQNGADPSLVGMAEYDSRSGQAATVSAAYINDAAARTGAPVIAVAPLVDTSGPVDLAARFPATLSDLLTGPMSDAGVAVDATVWVPGDALPLNFSSNTAGVVFTLRQTTDYPNMRWSDTQGKVSNVTMEITGATAHDAIVGLDGQGAAKVYDRVVADTDVALSPFELPEIYVEASNAPLGAASQAAGRVELAKARGSTGISFTVQDGKPWTFGVHYREGDTASARIAGVDLTARIAKVTASHNARDGFQVLPTIGDLTVDDSHTVLLAKGLASVARQVRMLQAGG